MAAIFDELTDYVVEHPDGRSSAIDNLPYRYIGFYFTASWCGACNSIFNNLRTIYSKINEFNRVLEIVNINVESTEEDAQAVVSKYPWWSLPFHQHRNAYLTTMFKARYIPMMFIFNRQGQLISDRGHKDMLQWQSDVIGYWDSKSI